MLELEVGLTFNFMISDPIWGPKSKIFTNKLDFTFLVLLVKKAILPTLTQLDPQKPYIRAF